MMTLTIEDLNRPLSHNIYPNPSNNHVAFEFKGNVVYLSDKADGQYKKTASNAKLRQHLPDFTFTPMRQAIRDTVNWFVETAVSKWKARGFSEVLLSGFYWLEEALGRAADDDQRCEPAPLRNLLP